MPNRIRGYGAKKRIAPRNFKNKFDMKKSNGEQKDEHNRRIPARISVLKRQGI